MEDNPVQKQAANWVPMPRYLLRRWVVRRLIRHIKPQDFIEIGSASGEMADWLSAHDIPGVAVEISPQALRMLRARFENHPRIQVHNAAEGQPDRTADLLLSMEVMEHLADDHLALSEWFELIRPGGHLLLSVPAGKRLFSAEDEMVGHFRRYERQELIEKLTAAGFERPDVLCYGFPLGLVLKKIRNIVAKRKLRHDRRDMQERTEASGVERQFLWLKWMFNNFFFLPFNLLQMPFLRLDWTDGYIAVARKPLTA